MQQPAAFGTGYNLPPVSQFGGQQPQNTTISDIFVGPATAATSTKRALDGNAIMRHVQSAAKAGPNIYWQVANPSRILKLSNAANYVTQHYPSPRTNSDKFVYWPDYRVAGTVRDIFNVFRTAGINQVQVGQNPNVPLTEQNIFGASYDPLNPTHRELLAQLAQQAEPDAGKRRERHSLTEYMMIGNALAAAQKQRTTSVVGTTQVRGTGVRGGGKTPQENQRRLTEAFDNLMTQIFNGMDVPKIYDVTKFDPIKFTNARLSPKPKSTRATSIRPVINVNGRPIAIPVTAQPVGAQNFYDYMRNVVGNSPQYASLVEPSVKAFQDILQQRTAPIGQPMPYGGVQQQTGLGALLSAAPQQQLQFAPPQQQLQFAPPQQQLQFALPQQQFGQLPQLTQPTDITSRLSAEALSPRSPEGATSPTGSTFQLPVLTGQQGYPLPLGGIGQPTGQSGINLPPMGGGLNLPQVGGGFNLPQVGGQTFSPVGQGSPRGQTFSPVGQGSPRGQGGPSIQLPSVRTSPQ